MKREKIGNLWQTFDYDAFKFIEGNRRIQKNPKLEATISERGMVSPVIVNEKLQVIDGQHRIEIARKLGTPVDFVIRKGTGKDDVHDLQITKHWKPYDFITSYADLGYPEYIRFLHLVDTYSVNISALAPICYDTTDSATSVKHLKSGTLTIFNYNFIVSFLEFYDLLLRSVKIVNNTYLAKAFYVLFRLVDFDKKRMIEKSHLLPEIINSNRAAPIILKLIVDAYNHKLRQGSAKYLDYVINAKGHIEFSSKLKPEVGKSAKRENIKVY